MAATARKPKAAAPAPQRPALPAGDDDEIIGIALPDPDAEPERVPLFAIGDEVHTMLKDPPLSLALTAMDIQRQRASSSPEDIADARGLAEAYVMQEMLGEDSYRALLASRTLTAAQYRAITERVTKRVLGALEDGDAPNS